MAFTTWSTTDKSASVTLSGGNLIATSASASTVSVRAADKQLTGKFYWEYTYTTVVNITTGGGVSWGGTAHPITWSSGSIQSACGCLKSGQVYADGSATLTVGGVAGQTISFGSIANGTIVCVAVDADARLIWFRLGAAGNWNNAAGRDPATGAGGISVIDLGVGIQIYPAASLVNSGDQITANFGGSAFTGAVPAGFTSGFPTGSSPVNAVATQTTLEQFLTTNPPAQVTQVTVEQWVTTATVTGQALVTQVALEQWVPAPKLTVELAGNLGGISSYGKLKYGVGKYSRINAFMPIFGGDLDVHISLVEFGGDIAPQIALGGSLSLFLPLTALDGSFGFSVVLAASSFVSGPLWVAEEPVAPPWEDSEPCPPPAWMITSPCEPVVWSKSRQCNG